MRGANEGRIPASAPIVRTLLAEMRGVPLIDIAERMRLCPCVARIERRDSSHRAHLAHTGGREKELLTYSSSRYTCIPYS